MRIIKRLSPQTQQLLKAHISAQMHLATPEQAKCAKDRLNFWLQAEPDYSSGKYRPAQSDRRLWEFCQRVYPEADLAQVYFAKGNKGIGWHRDARFCKSRAFIVNLGAVRLETQSKNDLTALDLVGGEIVEFDAKQMHRSIPVDEDRIGFAIWSAAIPIKGNWLSSKSN